MRLYIQGEITFRLDISRIKEQFLSQFFKVSFLILAKIKSHLDKISDHQYMLTFETL